MPEKQGELLQTELKVNLWKKVYCTVSRRIAKRTSQCADGFPLWNVRFGAPGNMPQGGKNLTRTKHLFFSPFKLDEPNFFVCAPLLFQLRRALYSFK